MTRIRTLIGAIALLLLLPLSACSVQQGSSSNTLMHSDAVATPESGAVLDGTAQDATVAPDGAAASRSIVRTGSIEIESSDVTKSTEAVVQIVQKLGGEVASQQVSGATDASQSGSLVIRVPAERFDETFDELATIGTVRSEQRASDDVTETHVDLNAHVEALQTSVDRLTALLAGADTTSDLLEIETTLSERQAELDGLQAQLTSLEGQISQATISVWLGEPTVLPGGGPQNFWEALKAGVESIGTFGSGFAIVFGISLPWLVILGVIATAICLPIALRRRTRKREIPTESVAISPER
ncbi:MAG: DUF4349 domain-containing protein [Leucobacter sp.]